MNVHLLNCHNKAMNLLASQGAARREAASTLFKLREQAASSYSSTTYVTVQIFFDEVFQNCKLKSRKKQKNIKNSVKHVIFCERTNVIRQQ